MNTPTHALLAAALFAKSGRPRRTAAAILGGLLPDLSLYGMVAWEAGVMGKGPQEIFDVVYFSRFWQSVFAIDNSAPLYALLLGLGLYLKRPWLWALAGGALLHIAFDLPLHHDDGRPHFWPFSDWVFESPVSYWDTQRYAGVVAPLETGLALLLAVVLWRRFSALWARALIGVLAAAQLSTGAFWTFVFA